MKLRFSSLVYLENFSSPLLQNENCWLETLAAKAGAAEQVEAVYKIVRHLAANQRGIVIKGDRTKPSNLQVYVVST